MAGPKQNWTRMDVKGRRSTKKGEDQRYANARYCVSILKVGGVAHLVSRSTF